MVIPCGHYLVPALAQGFYSKAASQLLTAEIIGEVLRKHLFYAHAAADEFQQMEPGAIADFVTSSIVPGLRKVHDSGVLESEKDGDLQLNLVASALLVLDRKPGTRSQKAFRGKLLAACFTDEFKSVVSLSKEEAPVQ